MVRRYFPPFFDNKIVYLIGHSSPARNWRGHPFSIVFHWEAKKPIHVIRFFPESHGDFVSGGRAGRQAFRKLDRQVACRLDGLTGDNKFMTPNIIGDGHTVVARGLRRFSGGSPPILSRCLNLKG